MENVKVYCIIVTYNAMKWVDKCLGSLRNSSLKLYPVIIDNCSNDETVRYIKENYPDAYLIANSDNRGFGQANNQGIEYAYKNGGTHFFLLNQDAWVHTNTVSRLVEVQDKYGIAIASPIHLNGPGNLLDFNYFSYSVLNTSNIDYVSDLILNNLKDYYSVPKINAAAWMLTKEIIERVGGFDPIFFHYGEDNNYCQRVIYNKEIVAFVTGAFIHHDRERKGNVSVFKKNAVTAKLLNEYVDINKNIGSLTKTRLKMHLSNFKLAVFLLLKLKLSDFAGLFTSYVTFIRKFSKIRYSRKINKDRSHNWLKLD
ncbi:glycosyltransferase family 2 protein [Sphingobacterium sp. 18053]|uniref:glycosyltransferase family 2 protein n=1 Tax=Sphingobacterium sp. 18053 TaxID=2681401 RepID=UPI00135AFBBB|nr:glycosyltransferase [Sphingobacterium sp. 18053]